MRKKIKGFSHYSIDEKGIVINDLTNKTKTPTSNLTGKGYMAVDLWESGKRYRKYIHRLVAETFIPNPEKKPYINHIDGNPKNNNVSNLEWCTPLENVEHASKVLGAMDAYNNANYKKHLVKLVTDLSKIYSTDFTKIMEKAQRKEITLSWCYVEPLKENADD